MTHIRSALLLFLPITQVQLNGSGSLDAITINNQAIRRMSLVVNETTIENHSVFKSSVIRAYTVA